ALGRRAAEPGIFLRVLEEIDDLDQFVLGLVNAGDVVEGNARIGFLVEAPRPALAEAAKSAEHAATLARRVLEQPDIERNDQQSRTEGAEQRQERAAFGLDGRCPDVD